MSVFELSKLPVFWTIIVSLRRQNPFAGLEGNQPRTWNKKFAPAYLFLACAYVELDRLDDANNTVRTVLEIIPQYTVKEVAKFWPYRIDQVQSRFLDSLRKAGLPEE